MPSSAFYNFKRNLNQVNKLTDAFIKMRPPTRGRKHLDHFTRAAIIFLCASWEVYIEQILLESGKIIIDNINSPDKLPMQIQKTISNKIRNEQNELEPVLFSLDWKAYYCKMIETRISNLNTPKNGIVLELFHKYLGIEGDMIKEKVPTLSKINDFIATRGDIAHNVFSEEYVTKELVIDYYVLIYNLVVDIECLLWDCMPRITGGGRPWQKTHKKCRAEDLY